MSKIVKQIIVNIHDDGRDTVMSDGNVSSTVSHLFQAAIAEMKSHGMSDGKISYAFHLAGQLDSIKNTKKDDTAK
ncbi:hypothetical protein N6G95_09745 [Pediococcus inopinatus]|uniref:hypothetical protein n=1 Tax=Pediococcus inopinatus TaxID=114090 RepID=UPI002B259C92|nr:hypothetical protein [Pediococcus inopinatus]WPC19485.1 hypothetical protein N6G95_09745 [Pediococcus inopinatus]